MNADSHIIFRRIDVGFRADGVEVQRVLVRPVNPTNFDRDFAGKYSVFRHPDGKTYVEGWRQARSKFARRHETFTNEQEFEATIIRWSNRIWREEQKEAVTNPSYFNARRGAYAAHASDTQRS